jgi:hypothetical protein
MDNELQLLIAKTKAIATLAHMGQKRRGGIPYITHPLRVAKNVEDRLKPLANLHDVPEDNKAFSIEVLKDLGVPDSVLVPLKLLTHDDNEPYLDYIKRIKTNPDAFKVKLADIEDNMNDNPSERQVKKYREALNILLDHENQKIDEVYLGYASADEMFKSDWKTSRLDVTKTSNFGGGERHPWFILRSEIEDRIKAETFNNKPWSAEIIRNYEAMLAGDTFKL